MLILFTFFCSYTIGLVHKLGDVLMLNFESCKAVTMATSYPFLPSDVIDRLYSFIVAFPGNIHFV